MDPLDGTREYTEGLVEHVTVLIGIAVGDQAIGGVIHQPFYNHNTNNSPEIGRTLWGIVGVGYGGFQPQTAPEGRHIITTTRSHSNKLVIAALEALKPDEVVRVGGAGHKVLLLIEGKAHAYVFASAGCKRWDTCAPEAVLVSIGGKLTDVQGNVYSYRKDTPLVNSAGVLGTGRNQDHGWYVHNMPEIVKQSLQ